MLNKLNVVKSRKAGTILTALFAIVVSATVISGCNKPDDTADTNWGAKVSGVYHGTNTHQFGGAYTTTITLNRVNDNTVTFVMVEDISGSSVSTCLDSVKLNSASAFTINEYENCYLPNQQLYGTGTINNSTLAASINSGFYSILATK